jgi:hypothetical protein
MAKREFQRVIFGRKLDEKDLRALLHERMRVAMTRPAPKAAPIRVESILIEPDRTTICLSGNPAVLKAAAGLLKDRLPDVKISKVSQAVAARFPGRGGDYHRGSSKGDAR